MKTSDHRATNRIGASPRSITESAVEWISRRDAGLSASEEAEFQAWRAADSRHAEAIDRLHPAWAGMNRLRSAGRGAALRNQVEQIVVRRKRRRYAVGLSGLAAAAAIALGFLLSHSAETASTIAVRPDRHVLADGSLMECNAGANIVLEFTPETRGVRLVSGEALFHVAPDGARPFVVTAGHVAVRAVGTVFTVRLDPQAVDVLVTQGRVAVKRTTVVSNDSASNSEPPRDPADGAVVAAAPPAPDVMLDAGKRVIVPLETALRTLEPQRVSPREVAAALAWRNQRVEFNGTSLAEALELFNRGNALQLSAANPEIAALRITGVFWTNDSEAFARAVETSLGLRAQPASDGRIVLSK